MRTLSLLCFTAILFYPVSLQAHGNHFHSLTELSAHIDTHLTELQAMEEAALRNPDQIKEECEEIAVHAAQYQKLAQDLIAKKQNIETAQMLNAISSRLIKTAQNLDLHRSVQHLQEIQTLLKGSLTP